MRWLVPAVVIGAAIACSKSEQLDENDFVSFNYTFSGTGIGGGFSMDRDCGLAAHGVLGFADQAHSGKAVAAPTECRDFKRFAVSEPAMAAYSIKSCPGGTDDYVSTGVTLTNGEVHALAGVGSGCSDDPKVAALRSEAQKLRDKYIPLTPPDAGPDTSTDGG